MISINFDTNVLMAQRNVNIASNLVNEALQRLTTGFRINSAADDPAGYYFASDLNTELRALSVAQQNIADGVIFMTTAQDSLFNMGDIINRLKDLALQGSNSTLDSSQRTAIQKETDALLEELFKLKNDSTYNDINVFGADKASNHALAVVSGVTPPPDTLKTGSTSQSSPNLNTTNSNISTQADITVTIMQGANSGLTEDILVLGGSIKVGNDTAIDTKDKTLEQIAQEITAQGNVTASIEDGKFTIKSENGEVNIVAEGDFARISGMGSYTVQSAAHSGTSAQYSYRTLGSATGLTGNENILGGSVKIGNSTVIDTKGKTLNQIIGAINAQGNATASITDGRFTVTDNEGIVTVQVEGDFARVTGLGNYVVSASSTTNVQGAYKGSFINSINRLTEEEAIAQGYTIIKTAQDLDNIRNNLSGKYILMNDIDLSSYTNWNPIGEYRYTQGGAGFTGILDGNGYKISNLTINRPDEHNTGLFASIGDTSSSAGEVKNLGLENVNIVDGDIYVAGLAAENRGTITNCYVTGNVNGGAYVGGLVGASIGTVSYCYSASNVSGGYIGGLVGSNSGNISNSYATGKVFDGGYYNGGLAGQNNGNISNCYATGDVDGYRESGALVGKNGVRGTISNCYALGYASASTDRGGLLGSNWQTITDSIWDSELNDVAIGDNQYGSDSNLKGLTTAEMQNPDNWTGWDTNVWDFSTYPPTIKDQNASSGLLDSSTITGSVDTKNLSETAFDGQATGTLSFSNGVNVSISSTDTRSDVIQKINDAGLQAQVGTDGKIQITAEGTTDLTVTSDSSGFADFYGLTAGKTYTGSATNNTIETKPESSTITGSVSTGNLADNYFYGQKDGQLSFSNGVNVSISATDTRSDVLQKINDAGLQAQIGADGKIQITAQGVSDLTVTSDSSGFSDFYGLDGTASNFNGSISTSTETIPDPDSGTTTDPTDPDDGSGGSTTDPDTPDHPSFDIAGLVTHGVSNIRLQIGTDGSDLSALYCDTTFLFDEFSLDMSDEDSCAESLEALEALSDAVNKKQSDIGIYITRLESIYQSNTTKIQNTYSAYSTVMDADIALETEKYVKNQIRQQTAASLLAQIQAAKSQMVMTLLGSIM